MSSDHDNSDLIDPTYSDLDDSLRAIIEADQAEEAALQLWEAAKEEVKAAKEAYQDAVRGRKDAVRAARERLPLFDGTLA